MAVVLVPAAYRAGLRWRFVWNPRHPAVKKLLSLSFWTLGFVAANIVALTVVRNLTEPGSSDATAYFLAFTFFILPHGLLGVSIATTFQPEMARAVAQRSKRDFTNAASLGIRMTALLTIPAGVGLFVLRRPLIGIALEYRNFTAEDALQASRALAGLALGLGAFSVYLFVLRAFYAHQDTKTAFKVNVVENLINIVLAIALVGSYGVLGLGASFAIAYIVSALWVLQILTYKVPGFAAALGAGQPRPDGGRRRADGRSRSGSWRVHSGRTPGGGALLRLAAGTVVGVAVYAGLLALMGAPELDALRRRLPGRTGAVAD